MKLALRLTAISFVISLAFGQLDNNEPTHIIKFRPTISKTAANNVLLSHHREFLTSVRNVRVDIQDNQSFSAAAAEQDMSMEHIDIGPDFVAIAGIFSDHAFLEYLHNQSTIDYVEPNQIYSTTHMQPSVMKHRINQKRELKTAQAANWGLARINQRQLGDLNEYQFNDISGEGVTVFVLDTGVYAEHVDFEGRASHSANVVKYEDATDMGGHGTHVSGKIIGKEYGVAKGAHVKSVKILNKSGDGSTSSLLRGVQHVIQNAVPGKTLVNLSLSGAKSKLLDEALDNLVLKYNIPVFVSAGNSGTDSCFFSPSSNPNVFSVGAIDRSDNVPKFSNVGECVDIYAPGRDIVSTYIGNIDSFKSMDGTSMASPHVAGIAANLMSKKQFDTAHEVYEALRALATSGVVHFDALKSSSPNNNLLAFNEI